MTILTHNLPYDCRGWWFGICIVLYWELGCKESVRPLCYLDALKHCSFIQVCKSAFRTQKLLQNNGIFYFLVLFSSIFFSFGPISQACTQLFRCLIILQYTGAKSEPISLCTYFSFFKNVLLYLYNWTALLTALTSGTEWIGVHFFTNAPSAIAYPVPIQPLS